MTTDPAKEEEVAAEETETICFRQIPKGTEKEKLEEHAKKFDGTVSFYKDKAKTPYAFADVPKSKVDEMLAAEFKLGDDVIEVQKKVPVIKYFLTSKDEEGNLNSIDEDKLKSYFEEFGRVINLTVNPEKETGFLTMAKTEETSGLAWRMHSVEDQKFNVKEEQERKRKRRGRGGWGRNKRGKYRGRGKRNN